MTITVNGKNYPVTDKFKSEVLSQHSDLAKLSYAQLSLLKKEIQDRADARYNFIAPLPQGEEMDQRGIITKKERDRLNAIQLVMNCHHKINFLAGKSHEDYGLTGIDQVQATGHTAECGCLKTFVSNKHDSDKPMIEHSTLFTCEKHRK